MAGASAQDPAALEERHHRPPAGREGRSDGPRLGTPNAPAQCRASELVEIELEEPLAIAADAASVMGGWRFRILAKLPTTPLPKVVSRSPDAGVQPLRARLSCAAGKSLFAEPEPGRAAEALWGIARGENPGNGLLHPPGGIGLRRRSLVGSYR